MKYTPEWKKYLVQTLKLYAKTLEENAEDIIGDYAFTGDLTIMFTLPTDKRSMSTPSIDVSKEYYPNYKCLSNLRETFEKEREASINETKTNKINKLVAKYVSEEHNTEEHK